MSLFHSRPCLLIALLFTTFWLPHDLHASEDALLENLGITQGWLFNLSKEKVEHDSVVWTQMGEIYNQRNNKELRINRIQAKKQADGVWQFAHIGQDKYGKHRPFSYVEVKGNDLLNVTRCGFGVSLCVTANHTVCQKFGQEARRLLCDLGNKETCQTEKNPPPITKAEFAFIGETIGQCPNLFQKILKPNEKSQLIETENRAKDFMLATFGKAYVKTNQRKLSFGRHRIDYPIDPHGTSRTLDGKENNQVRKWNQYLNLSEVCSQVKFAPDKNSATKEIAIQQSWTPADQ